MCPIDGCFRTSKNIGEHLRSQIHGLDPKEEEYKLYLEEAREFDASSMPNEILQSPRKNYGLVNKKKKPSSCTGI